MRGGILAVATLNIKDPEVHRLAHAGSPARLNFGDCFAYALAKVTGRPLLFKGVDFTHTDVPPAFPPE